MNPHHALCPISCLCKLVLLYVVLSRLRQITNPIYLGKFNSKEVTGIQGFTLKKLKIYNSEHLKTVSRSLKT